MNEFSWRSPRYEWTGTEVCGAGSDWASVLALSEGSDGWDYFEQECRKPGKMDGAYAVLSLQRTEGQGRGSLEIGSEYKGRATRVLLLKTIESGLIGTAGSVRVGP
jgi:hypothetical protein